MKIARTVDGQVIYSRDENDPPAKTPKPEPLIPESDPMCYAPQCMCKDTKGYADPFCPHYRKLHGQEIPPGAVIA